MWIFISEPIKVSVLHESYSCIRHFMILFISHNIHYKYSALYLDFGLMDMNDDDDIYVSQVSEISYWIFVGYL